MADSEKKKRKPKQADSESGATEVPPAASVDDSVGKSKKKSKRALPDAVDAVESPVEEVVESKEGAKLNESGAVSTVAESSVPVADSAPSSKRKSKKSGKESSDTGVAASEPVGESVAPSAPVSDAVASPKSEEVPSSSPPSSSSSSSSKKSSKKSDVVPKSDSQAVGADEAVAVPKSDASQQHQHVEPVPKRRQSVIGKFFGKLMGKGDSKASGAASGDASSKDKPKSSKSPSPDAKSSTSAVAGSIGSVDGQAKQVESADGNGDDTSAPRKKKSNKSKQPKSEEDDDDGDGVIVHIEGEGLEDDANEEAVLEEEGVEEESSPVSLAPPPKFPPPSAPRKAPSGPVKEQLAVTSVFSMKPQMKVEVAAAEEAIEYSNEEVKREIDFALFMAANPQYAVGKELSETAFNRTFAAKRKSHEKEEEEKEEDVIVKFYSNEPPRLIPEATIASQVKLVQQLSKDNKHILPILDEFVGELFVEPIKHSKHKEEAEEEKHHHDDDETTKKVEIVEHEKKKNKSGDDGGDDAKKEEEEKKEGDDTATATVSADDKDSKKKSKKKKNAEGKEEVVEKEDDKMKKKDGDAEDAAVAHPKPPHAGSDATSTSTTTSTTAAAAPASTAARQHAQEHDYYLVYKSLPDAVHFARHHSGVYSEKTVARIVSGVLSALESIHALGFMHRAVAPANIVVNSDDGDSLLTGFDMCCKIDEPKGHVMTSEKFKAPEITHAPKHDQAVDLWGVGTVTYFLLTGRHVFRETNNARLKIAIREANVNYEQEDWEHISKEAQDFCKALILKDPSTRLSVKAALKHPWLANAPSATLEKAVANLNA